MTHGATKMPALRAPVLRVIVRQVGCAALALSLAACTQGGSCKLVLATTVPMRVTADGGRLVIAARYKGAVLPMMVDTGASVSFANQKIVAELATLDGGIISGVGGAALGTRTQLPDLALGRLSGFMTVMVADRGFGSKNDPIDGLLGMDVMSNYDVDVDVAGGKLGLYLPVGDCTVPNAALAGPLFGVSELPDLDAVRKARIEVKIGGQSFHALLDSGSPNTMILRSAAQRLGLTGAALGQDEAVPVHGMGPNAEIGHLHVLDEIAIGDLALRHVPVTVLDENLSEKFDVVLGLDFFKRAHVWISNSSHSLVLQVPPTPTPEITAAR